MADAPTTTPDKKVVKHDDHVEPPIFGGDGASTSTSLSQQATQPGDQSALTSVKGKTDAPVAGLPHIEVGGDQTAKPVPQLDHDALLKTAQELHDAIKKTSWFGLKSSPDNDQIMRLLEPLSAADRTALEKIYHDQFDQKGAPDSLRRDLKDKLGEYDFRKAEAVLNRSDNRTNDAGALMVALTHCKDDKDRGNAEVRAVLQNLNSQQLKQLDDDFKKAYNGQSYIYVLNNNKDLSPATKESLKYLEKGVDKRTADDLVQMAHLAVENGDQRLFAESIKGDSPEAQAARKAILADENFKNQIADKFPSTQAQDLKGDGIDPKTLPFEKRVDQVALDYLQEGRISLATVTSENTGKWIFDNKDNIELAARNASDKERQDFTAGRDLALSNKAPANDTEKAQLDFYNKIHDSFKKGGNDREVSIWEDQLMHGRETIVSEMAKGHSDGWGPFHFGSGTNMNDVMTKVENLSKDDWTLLKGPDGAKFRQQISDSLGTYADQGEKDRVMKMLDAKIAAPTYEDAAKIHRNLEDTIKDNKGYSFLCFGTSYDGKNILSKVTNMSPEDAANYKNDPNFKKDIDKFINDNINDDEKLYAQRLLKQVDATGQPPKPDALDTILGDKVNGAKPEAILKDAETALQDPALRERLNKPDNQLSDDDKKIKQVIENAVAEAAMKNLGYPPDSYDDSMFQKYSKPLFETGHIPDDLKLDLGFPKTDLLPAIAAAPQAERDAAMKKLDANEQQIVQGIMSNNDGKPDLADRIREFTTGVGGDAADFKDELSKLSFADRQALKDEYAKKYKSDLDNDFLGKLKDTEQDQYKALLTPGTSDGRQQYYDNYHRMLRSESGFSPDGSQLTMERANDLYANSLEEYQKVYKTLPPDKQQALDKYFGDSLEQYKASKEKLAEILVDATITAAALAATPFTGGASLAAVIAIAAASGAAFRVGAMGVIEGNDMNWSAKNVVKQLVIGGTSAALNFGAGAFAGAGQLATGVAETAVADAAVIGGKEILTQSGKEILAKELPDLIKAGGQQLSEKELGALIEKAAPLASDAEKAALKNAIEESVAKNYGEQQAKIAEEVANRTKLQAAKYLGKEVVQSSATGGAANAVSDLVAAPFNENGIDWKQLGMSTLTGFAIGAVIPIGFHGVKAGKDFVVNMTKTSEEVTVMENGVARTVTRDTAVIDPDQNVRTVIKHADGSPDTVLEPGKGEPPYKPKDGDTIVEGKERPPETRPKEVPSTTPEAAEITKPPSAQALKQTNEFATSHQIDGPLEDGFIYGGANRQFDKFGKPNFGTDPAFVVNKQELAPIIEDAKAKFGNLPPEERAAALAKYVHEKFNPPGMSQQDINTWYLDFLDKHPGQTVSLNDFIKAGKGVCTQESVLYKVLGDELGLHPSLVRGNGLNGGDDINHLWTTIDLHDGQGPRVYDPRQDIAGTPVDEVPSHKPGAQIVAEGKGQVELNMKPGVDKFDYDGVDGWVVDKYNADGSVDIRRPGTETVDKSKLQDFQALNGDQLARDGGLKVGERYSVRKSDGTIDSNWRLDGIEPDGSLRLSNERAWHQEGIPREAIVGRAPELFGTPGEAATAIKNSKNMDEFYDNAVEALGAHQTDPAVVDAVKTRLGQEISTPDIFKNPDKLSQLRDIANEYGLGADLDSQLGSRVSAEFKNNPNLLKDADQVKEIKQIIQGMHPPNAEMAQEIKARLSKEILSPDLLKDPIKAAEIADLAKASGISKDLSAEFSKRLSDELKSNKTLFTDKTQLENLKTIVASMKESGAQFDDKFQNAFFDRVRIELANKNKGAVADMHAMADQIGTVKTKNAVRYFEINRVAFDGTIEKPLTDAQLQGLGSAQKFRDSISGKVRPADLNDDLKEVGAYIDPEAMGKSHMHSANIYDKATGKPMMDYSARGLKDGKPYKIIGVSIDGGIDQNYQRRVWDSVIAQYLAGLR